MQALLRKLVVGVLAVLAPQVGLAQVDFVNLLTKVPEEANSVAFVKVNEIFNSPLALKEKWSEQDAYSRVFGTGLRNEADYIIFASQVNLGQGLKPSWEMMLATPSRPVDAATIAANEGGAVDTLAETPVVWTPRNGYVAVFGPRLVGARFPADRQDAARWIKGAKDRRDPVVSPFLRRVAARVQGTDAQIVMAFDTAELLSPELLRPHIGSSRTFEPKLDDLDAIAESLATVEGVVLAMKVDTEINGFLRLDLTGSTAPLKRVAKPLLIEAMQGIGAELDDLRDWRVKIEEKTITLQGPLSTDGARRLGSLLELDLALSSKQDAVASTPGQPVSPNASPGSNTVSLEETKKYYNALLALIDDLEKDKAKSQRTMALWTDRYATKIDRMPILGVDPDLLDFSKKVSITFRNLALTAQGSSLAIQNRGTTEGAVSVGFGYGGYYGYGYGMTAQGTSRLAMERITKQENIAATSTEIQTWAQLRQGISDLDRLLTMKYGVEF